MEPRAELSRRQFLATTGAALAGAAVGAPALVRAQGREIVVGGPGGMANVLRDEVIPSFEKKHNCKVLYEGSRSLINLQKLETNRQAPKLSVVLMDEDIMLRAAEEDLIARVSPADVPMLSKILPQAIRKDGLWINYKTPRGAIAYNSKALPGGVPTWAELWEAKYRKKVLLPHMGLTSAVNVLTVAAHLATGKPLREAQYDLDAAFKKLAALKPNLLNIYTNPTQAHNLLEQGEGWVIPGEIGSYVLLRKSQGAPVDMAKPKEGSFSLPSGLAKVKSGPNPELAHAFIDTMLDVPAQKLWAERFFDSPANPATPVGPDIVSPAEMFATDWEFVSKNRKAWIERFDREIAA
jgi:putative spermidine/putrescine transport system substrate-binding protein